MTADLTTDYLGLRLKNPVVVGASPMTATLEPARRLEQAGAAAIVMPSLFEEQIEHEELELSRMHDAIADFSPEADSYFPDFPESRSTPDLYLDALQSMAEGLDIPVIASLNGTTDTGWIRYARLMEEKGARGLELNIYFLPTDVNEDGPAVESRYLKLVESVCKQVTIPVAVKVGPHFSSLPHMSRRLIDAGAAGLVLFNRFYAPDIDLESLTVVPSLELSSSYELRLPLRWIALLSGSLEASLASSTGVHTAEDVVKLLLAGADVTQVVSAVLRKGPGHVTHLVSGLASWLSEREYASVAQMKGSMSRPFASDPEAYERANYMKTLLSFTSDWA